MSWMRLAMLPNATKIGACKCRARNAVFCTQRNLVIEFDFEFELNNDVASSISRSLLRVRSRDRCCEFDLEIDVANSIVDIAVVNSIFDIDVVVDRCCACDLAKSICKIRSREVVLAFGLVTSIS